MFVAIWLLSLVALAGLLNWGIKSSSPSRVKPREAPAQHAASGHRPAPAVLPPSTRPAPEQPVAAAPEAAAVKPRDSRTAAAQKAEQVREPVRHPVHEQQNTQDASSHPEKKESLSLAYNRPPPKQEPPSPPPPELAAPIARVAIVIDDFGNDTEVAKKFLQVPLPITFSVLPYQEHSREIAQMANSHGHEVIVHIPMEPKGYPRVNPGSGALLLSMTKERIQSSLQAILDSNPYADGINNHMGSSFTENPETMEAVLAEVKRRGLYFLDSYTTTESVGLSLARKMQIHTGRRDIFLDHVSSERFISSQIDQLIQKAKIQGTSVAIGHPHENTLRVLKQAVDRFKREKVAVVPLGSLMNSVK